MIDCDKTKEQLMGELRELRQRVSQSKEAEEELKRIEWLLTPTSVPSESYAPTYGNLVELNTSRTILDSVGEEALGDIAGDALDLLGTSAAVYEKNGDYALGIFSSGWCRFLDQASFRLCQTNDPQKALESGLWLCHESCWTKASKTSIETGQSVDIECHGGIHLYACPIFSEGQTVGSINVGYGDPPREVEKIREIADKYGIDPNELMELSNSYESRPPFIIDAAKRRLESAARLIGALVERRQAQKALQEANEELERRVAERTTDLRTSEERYRTLFDDSRDGVYATTRDGKFLEANKSLLELFGYDREEFMALNAVDLYMNPSDRQRFQDLIEHKGYVENHEVKFRKKDGTEIHCLMTSSLRRDKDGTRAGYQGIIRDVTRQKQIEEARFRDQQFLKAVLENIDDGIVACDSEGVLTLFNRATRDFHGLPQEALTPDRWAEHYDLYLSDGKTRMRQEDIPLYRAWKGETVRGVEMVIAPRHARSRTVMASGGPLLDSDGKSLGAVVVMHDVTDRKEAEEALRQSEQALRTLVHDHPEAVLLMDTEGTILACSHSTAQRLGRPMHEVLGSCIYNFLPSDVAEARRERVQEVIHTGRPFRFEDTRFGRTIDNHIQPVVDAEGKVVRLVILGIDITPLRKAEEVQRRLATAIEQAAEAVVITDAKGVIQYVNPNTEQITGFKRSEVIGNNPRIFKSGEHDRAFYEQLWNTITTGKVWSGRIINKKKDGTLYQEDATISPVRDASGEIVNFVAVKRDVTERQNAEVALRVQTERFRSLVDGAPFGMVMIGKDGTYEYVNPRFTEIFGYDLSDVPNGRHWFRKAFPDPAYRKEVIGAWLADVKYAPWGQTRPRIFSVTCKDGSAKLIHFRPVRLSQGEDLITLEDITDQAKAEAGLRESEERIRRLIESSPVGIGIVQDGRYVYANPALVTILGASSSDEIVGESPLAFIVPEDRDLVRQRGKQRLKGLEPDENYQVGGLRKNGESFDMSTWPTRIDYMGKRALLSFVADVTEQNRLRAQFLQAQKMEAIGTLAGGVAHDFNNLLTVVTGFSELLLVGMDDQNPSYADLQRINQAGQRGADLVQRLLAFSRKSEPKPRPLNLNHQIEQLQKMLTRIIPRMIKMQLSLAKDLWPVNADPTQVDQVVMNLAVNARDAMPEEGNLTIETANVSLAEEDARAHLGTTPGKYVLLSVSDTGHGMDKETLDHIFEPFYTTKEAGKGTGLGLAMVYGIVTQHGGQIRCYSKPGRGTMFKIYLPALVAEKEQLELRTHEAMPRGGTETILLVDDDEDIREFGTRILSQAGYTVLSAANGKEALEVYQREGRNISLVILDMIMPEMGGTKCLKELLRTDPQAKVLVATGRLEGSSVREAFEMGAKGFVQKPFRVRDLCGNVRKVLDER